MMSLFTKREEFLDWLRNYELLQNGLFSIKLLLLAQELSQSPVQLNLSAGVQLGEVFLTGQLAN